jgi:hypothetical protein
LSRPLPFEYHFGQHERVAVGDITMPYFEMGQGTSTSIPMQTAVELQVSLRQVQLEHKPPNEELYANPLHGEHYRSS